MIAKMANVTLQTMYAEKSAQKRRTARVSIRLVTSIRDCAQKVSNDPSWFCVLVALSLNLRMQLGPLQNFIYYVQENDGIQVATPNKIAKRMKIVMKLIKYAEQYVLKRKNAKVTTRYVTQTEGCV